MLDNVKLHELKIFAQKIRMGTVDSIRSRGFGHIGGSLSVADVLAVLYGEVMKIDPKNPNWPQRDKLVCSKGHAGPAVYATLGLKGYFPYEDILTLNQPGTNFPSHCDKKKTPGVDMTTGSLGQGSSTAVGMALADKLKGRDNRVFLLMGDGEINEGQVWEAAMFASAKRLTNIVFMVDWNKKQLDGYTEDIFPLGDLVAKYEAFGFETIKIDGNDIEQVYKALTKEATDRPIAIILDTVKGKGVKEVEDTVANHSMTVAKEVFDGWYDGLSKELEQM